MIVPNTYIVITYNIQKTPLLEICIYIQTPKGCPIAAAWPTTGRPYSGKRELLLIVVPQLTAP